MRVLQITPGTGNFHCGSCLRDNALVKALRKRGHEVLMLPLYLPLVTDDEPASPDAPLMVGGISLYLIHKMPWLRWMPRSIRRWLDSPTLLRRLAKRSGMTNPRVLGKLTVGSLLGSKGPQSGEWEEVARWAMEEFQPDVVSLSNGLLSGLAEAFQRMGVPVVVSLQGEDSFLDTLPEPWASQAWEAFRENGKFVNRFIAVSGYYRDVMRERLGLSEEKIVIVENGLDSGVCDEVVERRELPVVGYLAKMCPAKGLHILVEAYLLLADKGAVPGVGLCVVGALTKEDEIYVRGLRNKIAHGGYTERVEFHENVDVKRKRELLQGMSVLSVPATYGEAFGLYILEALAFGVPVVQPEHGAFPELLERTGGGVLCRADDVPALARALEELLLDEPKRMSLGQKGRDVVRTYYAADRMAADFEGVCVDVVQRFRQGV